MGILIKAPTRRHEPPPALAEPREGAAESRGNAHIREVVRITGLRREQLYMWQRRYGFPGAAARRLRRSRLSAGPGRAPEAHQAAAVGRLARGRGRAAGRIGAAVDAGPHRRGSGAAAGRDRDRGQAAWRSIASASCRTICRSCSSGQGLRKFLETTLIPLNEAVHERVVRGEMQNFQELRFADLAQRLLRDVTRLVRPTRDARQILLATPPNDPNQLGLAILELLLFTDGINCLTLGAGVPAQEIAGAAEAYKVALVVLLFDRGISGKIAGQEIRSLRTALPESLPLVVSGRAVNLLAKPIADVHTAADFSSIMATMRELGVVPQTTVTMLAPLSREPRVRA